MYTKPASGSGAEETLLKSERNKIPLNSASAGRFLLYRVSSIGATSLRAANDGSGRRPQARARRYELVDERRGSSHPTGSGSPTSRTSPARSRSTYSRSRRRMAGGRSRREGRAGPMASGRARALSWGSTAVCLPRPFPSAKAAARFRRARQFRFLTRGLAGGAVPGRTVSRYNRPRRSHSRDDQARRWQHSEIEVILNWRGRKTGAHTKQLQRNPVT